MEVHFLAEPIGSSRGPVTGRCDSPIDYLKIYHRPKRYTAVRLCLVYCLFFSGFKIKQLDYYSLPNPGNPASHGKRAVEWGGENSTNSTNQFARTCYRERPYFGNGI